MAVRPSLRGRLEGSGVAIQQVPHTLSDVTIVQLPCFGIFIGSFDVVNLVIEDWFGNVSTFHFAAQGPHEIFIQPKIIRATGSTGANLSPANTVILYCLE